ASKRWQPSHSHAPEARITGQPSARKGKCGSEWPSFAAAVPEQPAPFRCFVGLAPGLVVLDQPLERLLFGLPPRLGEVHALVTLAQQRLGLFVLALAGERAAEQAHRVVGAQVT